MIERLPNDCTWNDVAYAVYVCQEIEAGLRDAEAGRLIDHDELFRELLADDVDAID